MKSKILAILCLLSPLSVMASEAIPSGYVKSLSYRGGWVMFKVVNDAGVNYCEACPTDPGKMGTKRCWVEEDKTAQISMLLSAQAREKKISGRINTFESCNVYQMTVLD